MFFFRYSSQEHYLCTEKLILCLFKASSSKAWENWKFSQRSYYFSVMHASSLDILSFELPLNLWPMPCYIVFNSMYIVYVSKMAWSRILLLLLVSIVPSSSKTIRPDYTAESQCNLYTHGHNARLAFKSVKTQSAQTTMMLTSIPYILSCWNIMKRKWWPIFLSFFGICHNSSPKLLFREIEWPKFHRLETFVLSLFSSILL